MKAKYVRRPRVTAAAGGALLSALITVAAGPAHAQQANGGAPNPYTDLSQYLVVGDQAVPRQALATPTAGALSSTVTQIGQSNVASANLAGSANATTQYQNGSYNSSVLSISGMQNSITTTQVGSSNTTSIDIVGNGNSISNLQVGSGLSYHLQVVGTSVPVSVQQYGRK